MVAGFFFFCHKILKKPSSNRQKLSYSDQAKESAHKRKQTKILISLEYQVDMDRSNNVMSIFIVLVL